MHLSHGGQASGVGSGGHAQVAKQQLVQPGLIPMERTPCQELQRPTEPALRHLEARIQRVREDVAVTGLTATTRRPCSASWRARGRGAHVVKKLLAAFQHGDAVAEQQHHGRALVSLQLLDPHVLGGQQLALLLQLAPQLFDGVDLGGVPGLSRTG